MVIKRLYHGTNSIKDTINCNSCFTSNRATAKDYAFYWCNEYGGQPYTFIIEGDFEKVGEADQYHLIGKHYKIIQKIKHRQK
jgi:hypothetical protein